MPMSGAMPIARTLLITLLLTLFAAPAQAWQPSDRGPSGDVAPAFPNAGDPSAQPAPPNALDDLLDLLPDLGEDPAEQLPPPVTSATVPGTVARLRVDGTAAVPLGAPKRVRRLISQYNKIVGKRYKWGGGHAVVDDRAFDCSGAVGYGLIKTGMLGTTMVSGSFARWAAAGEGRWMTIYANRSHVYTEIAGLRLDTSPVGDWGGAHGVRGRPVIGRRVGFKARHPVGL